MKFWLGGKVTTLRKIIYRQVELDVVLVILFLFLFRSWVLSSEVSAV